MKVPKARKLQSGTWFIQLRLGGKSVPITAQTEKECKRQAELIKAEYRMGKFKVSSPNNMLLIDACNEYISKNMARWSPTTTQGYQRKINNHFPLLMKTKLGNINSDVLNDAVSYECARTNRNGRPYSAKTIRDAYCFVAEVLKAYHVDFDTPRLPEIKRKPIQILTPEQVFAAVKGTDIELPCLLAMWMTYSISEIRGFTKSKSIRNGQVSVIETVVDVHGKPVRKVGGKEQERTRTQNIPPYIQNLIDAVDNDIICPLSAQATNKRLQRQLKKSNLPIISFHKLRHISASVGAALNIPEKYMQERGGWKSDHTMKTVYTHTFTAERIAADSRIDKHFEKIVGYSK